jgi:hypothetical protein
MSALLRRTPRLVADYRPSQPHGWPPGGPEQPVGVTLGGHTPARDFTHRGRTYRIALSAFGESTATPDPAYLTAPEDPTVDFVGTLAGNFGGSYAFDYAGGLSGRGRFQIQSYTVTVTLPTDTAPLQYGADLYVVYDGGEDPGQVLRFIQVANAPAVTGGADSFVDNGRRANPFATTGGPTSVNGHRVVNFYQAAITTPMEAETDLGASSVAEVFLVRDTGRRDAAGRDMITVLGGIRYGWTVRAVVA